MAGVPSQFTTTIRLRDALEVRKKGRRELMVACALAFGETRRSERLGDTERFGGYYCLHNSPLSSILRVKRKQQVKRFKRLRSGLRRNTEVREARRHGEVWGLLLLALFLLTSVLRVKRKQQVKRFKCLRSGLRRNAEDKEVRKHGEVLGLL